MAPALLLSLLLAAQEKPADKCTLSGSVVDSVTGETLKRAEVFAEPEGAGPPATTTTDSKGNFTLVDLDPGEYKLRARRNGYLDTHYGARRSEGAGTTVALEPASVIKDIQIKLIQFAVLGGVVRETDGEPLAGAHVRVYSLKYNSGRRQIDEVTDSHTDDLGQYRIASLPPGKYYIRAEPHRDDEYGPQAAPEDHSPQGAAREVLLPAIYPGVVDAAAARAVDVAPGSRVTGLDIALPRSRVVRVTGHLAVPAGTTAKVSLEPSREFEGIGTSYEGIVKPNGDFEIARVPAGAYRLNATAFLPRKNIPGFMNLYGAGEFRTSLPLNVGSVDVAEVSIAVTAGPEIDGHITVEGESKADLDGVVVQFDDSAAEGGGFAPILEGHRFSTLLSPGSYSVLVHLRKTGLVIKSIRAGSSDILRDGLTVSRAGKISLEIVLAPDGGQIDGVVLDKDDKPMAGATVILVPEPVFRNRRDRFADVVSDQNGRYMFEEIPPGDYKIFAWDDIEPDSWFDPEFFRDIEARGEAVKLDIKGHASVQVRAAPVR